MIQVDWKPDKKIKQSIHAQIVDYFKDKIETGEWPIGAKLPSQRRLAEVFAVNRTTVVAAVNQLKDEGVLVGRGRGGTQIAAPGRSLLEMTQTKWQSYIEDGFHMPNYKTIKMINNAEPDTSMLRLSSGEGAPDMLSTSMMQDVLSEVSKEVGSLGYNWPKGIDDLRVQLSKYLKTIGIDASPNCILIVSGALQAIQLISIGLLQAGSTVFVERPSYIYSLQILQTLGMRRVGISMDEDGIVCDQIPAQIRKSRASILYTIPNYQNPTGITMSSERRQALIDVCKKEKLPIIEDDVYGELWIDKPPPSSLKSLDTSGNVLYIGSVSKTLSPGLRIGWVVGPEPVVNRLADIKMQMDYGSSSLSQLTVSKWLETGLYQAHLTHIRGELKKRRDYTLQLLDLYFGEIAEWTVPKGGYYVWVRLKASLSMYKIFEDAFNHKLLLYPGYIYEAAQNNNLRISYSYATYEELEDGLRTLSQIIKVKL